jgi:hypothetical protein
LWIPAAIENTEDQNDVVLHAIIDRVGQPLGKHYIDNLDAKMEMLKDAYAQSKEIAPKIYEKVFPLPANLVAPLSCFLPTPNAEEEPIPEINNDNSEET